MTQELDLWFDPAKCLIGGKWVAPVGGGELPLNDPSTGARIGAIARGGAEDIEAAVEAAEAAMAGEWGRTNAAERGRFLFRLRALVLEKVDHLARIESIDVGKPLGWKTMQIYYKGQLHPDFPTEHAPETMKARPAPPPPPPPPPPPSSSASTTYASTTHLHASTCTPAPPPAPLPSARR